MQERLDKLYDEITDIENAIEEVETRLYNIRQQCGQLKPQSLDFSRL